MNDLSDKSGLALEKFGIGQPVLRVEDPKLLRGRGRYTDDVNLPGQAYAVMVRSRYAHGTIRTIDTARRAPCRACSPSIPAADLVAGGRHAVRCGVVKSRDGWPWRRRRSRRWPPTRSASSVRRSPVVVAAEPRSKAKDAAEAVSVEIDPLAGRGKSGRAAAAPGAALVHEERAGQPHPRFTTGATATRSQTPSPVPPMSRK